MAVSGRALRPVAHGPLLLGLWHPLEVAAVLDQVLAPHPENMGSCGRGGDALGLAILEGAQALYQVGHRLEARGLLPLLQAGLQRASLPASRLGPRLATLGAAPLHPVCQSLALQALQVYAIPPLWCQQDTTPIPL